MKYQRKYLLFLTAAVLLSACMLNGCEKKNDDSTPEKDTTAVTQQTTAAPTEDGTNAAGGVSTDTAAQSTSDLSAFASDEAEENSPSFSTEEGEVIMTVTTPKHTSAATIAGSKSDAETSETTANTASQTSEAASASAAQTDATVLTSAAVSKPDGDTVELPFVPFE